MMVVEVHSSTTEQGMEVVIEKSGEHESYLPLLPHQNQEEQVDERAFNEGVEVVMIDPPTITHCESNDHEQHTLESDQDGRMGQEDSITSSTSTAAPQISQKYLVAVAFNPNATLADALVTEVAKAQHDSGPNVNESDQTQVQVTKPPNDSDPSEYPLMLESSALAGTHTTLFSQTDKKTSWVQPKSREKTTATGATEKGMPEQCQTAVENDPYEWAYTVWRRRGLLYDTQPKTKISSTNPSLSVSPYRKSRHSLPALSVSSMHKLVDQECFSSVMNRWKVKSESSKTAPVDVVKPEPIYATEQQAMLFPVTTRPAHEAFGQ